MRLKFHFLALTCLFILPGIAQAQMTSTPDPTTWSYEAKKTGNNEYELIFHVVLKRGWHIFSQQPGDEFLIPPSFHFNNAGNFKYAGKVREEGKLIGAKLDGIDKPVNYYEGQVDFVQKIQAKGSLKITGELEYQVCNESMCLPPKKIPFEFDIK